MNDDQTTEEYIMRWVNGYCNAMNHLPSTRIMERKSSCTDPAIKVIVKTARGLSESEAEAGEVYHNLFMSAENIQGNLLEEYIASKVCDNGIKLVSAMENIPDTPEGIILESLLEGMAEYYSAECFYGHNISKKRRRTHLLLFTSATPPESICYFFSASTSAFIKDTIMS